MGAHLRHARWRWTSYATRGNGVEMMPVFKRTYGSRKIAWAYEFALPGAPRHERARVSASGFATKREAEDAEARRRLHEEQKRELAMAGAAVAVPLPKTLAMLLEEFFRQHVDENLAPKTI